MTPSDHLACRHLDDFLDGMLDLGQTAAFREHLEGCAECRRLLDGLTEVREAMAESYSAELPDDRNLRIRRVVPGSYCLQKLPQDIMDIEELAAFLCASVEDIIGMLDQVPAFEINGRLRFRRDKIVEWIEREEAGMQWERDVSMMRRSERNVILYRKQTDDDTDEKRRIV